MPNMIVDNLIKEAITLHTVATLPGNAQFALEAAVQSSNTTAALAGLFTSTTNVAAYSNTLVQLLIKRLVDMGYGASLSTNTLTVTW